MRTLMLLLTLPLACDDTASELVLPDQALPPDGARPVSFEFEQILGRADGLAAPDGLVARADGRVLVANEQGGNVLVVDVEARSAEVLVAGLRAPEEVAIGPDGAVYVSDDSAGAVFRVENGQPQPILGRADGLQSPEGIAVGADGAVFVADERTHLLQRLDPDGTLVTLAREADGVWAPEGLALDADGALYATDDQRGGVLRVAADGAISVFVDADTLGRPEAVAVGPDGDLWFTDNAGAATLQRFGPDGQRKGLWQTPVDTGHLAGVAVLADGRVVMSAFHNSGVHAIWLATPEAQ